ncbi:hypothetical protein [Legionella fairfieldensis]|uniref:hypothetical protein n=1 Tax=Legionella fairfieldensis TaxID=45064 RepID=UPI00048ADC39|nr:hypothetical protein [Legionella fairfieldensis]
MKINEEIPIINQPPLIRDNKKIQNFEHWLPSPTGEATGDEYYWQHQQDLQHSALHFQHFQNAKKNDITPIESAKNTDISCLKVLPSEKAAAHLMPPSPINSEQFYPSASIQRIFQQFVRLFEPASDNNIIYQANINEQNSSNVEPYNKSLVNEQTKSEKSFKNYHLFIDANQAEFTFNTTHLDTRQVKDLSLLIRQWLGKRGIRLQQLIINGVTQ